MASWTQQRIAATARRSGERVDKATRGTLVEGAGADTRSQPRNTRRFVASSGSVSPSIISRLARALVRPAEPAGHTRSRAVVGGSLWPAGLVFRREAADGRVVTVAFRLPHRVWQAKESGGSVLYEARSLRDAVADASGDDPEAPWIRRLEAEITTATRVAGNLDDTDRPGRSRRKQ